MNQQDKDHLRDLADLCSTYHSEGDMVHTNSARGITATFKSAEKAILSLLAENEELEAKLNDLQTMYRAFRKDYDRYNEGDASMPFNDLRTSLDFLIDEHEVAMAKQGEK